MEIEEGVLLGLVAWLRFQMLIEDCSIMIERDYSSHQLWEQQDCENVISFWT